MRRAIFISLLMPALAACDTSQPSHLPNILQLPGAAISTGVENVFYSARRKRVSAFVRANYSQLVSDIIAGNIPLPYQAMDVANVPDPARPVLYNELRSNPDIYLTGNSEKMIVALMVHGN